MSSYVSEIIEYRCDSLKGAPGATMDVVKGCLHLIPTSDNFLTHRIGYIFDARHWTLGDIGVTLHDAAGEEVPLTAIPVNPVPAGNFLFRVEYLLFFHHVLRMGDQYKLRFNSEVSNVLVGLVEPKRKDTILRRNTWSTGIAKQITIAYVPAGLGPLICADCLQADRGTEPTWRSGSEMTPADIRRVGEIPAGYNAVGWMIGGEGGGLNVGESTGFTVLRG